MDKLLTLGIKPNNEHSFRNTIARALTSKWPYDTIAFLCQHGALPPSNAKELIQSNYSSPLDQDQLSDLLVTSVNPVIL